MTEISHQSPQEPDQPPRRPRQPHQIAAAGCLLAASVPAGFICGGITCYSAGLAGEAVNTEAGWTLGIPLALMVVVLVPCLAYLALPRPRKSEIRYSLRTLLIVLGIAPPAIAGTLWLVQRGQ